MSSTLLAEPELRESVYGQPYRSSVAAVPGAEWV